jgi:hypothetical protein
MNFLHIEQEIAYARDLFGSDFVRVRLSQISLQMWDKGRTQGCNLDLD